MDESAEEEVYRPKALKAISKAKSTPALRTVLSNDTVAKPKARAAEEDKEPDKKKKKRKLFSTAAAFDWDPVLNVSHLLKGRNRVASHGFVPIDD